MVSVKSGYLLRDSLIDRGRNGEEDFSSCPGCLRQSCGSEAGSQVQPFLSLGFYPLSGLWRWFLSTISHSNHIFVASKKSATA